jgi:hypothetical protein
MRSGAFGEAAPARPLLLTRIRSRWWVFFFPLYPFVWLWMLSFLFALFIDKPIEWNHLSQQDHSYVSIQLHPYRAWPVREPYGKFQGAALTRNLSGFIEAADLKEFWLVPLHFQVAKRLEVQIQAPPSAFLNTSRISD